MVSRWLRLGTSDLLIMIAVIGILLTVLCVTTSDKQDVPKLRAKRLTAQQKRVLCCKGIRGAELAGLVVNSHASELDTCQLPGLDTILVERVPGTQSNRAVRDHLAERLRDLEWQVEFDTFTQDTIIGEVEFSNIIATSNTAAEQHVLLTAHYDSKYFAPQADGSVFVGAIDSAVPCLMILNILDNLNQLLQKRQKQDPERGIIVVLFDGEEAFKEWTSTDSVYGSRHLAEKWHTEGFLDNIELFVLLDLIGGADPTFTNSYTAAGAHFSRLAALEQELTTVGLLTSRDQPYFKASGLMWGVQDDHRPFAKKGLDNIVHLIPVPFPSQWHKMTDDQAHLHCPTIHELQSLLQVWVAEMFNLHKLINM